MEVARCHPYVVPIIPFSAETTSIEGLFVVQMKQITDDRGTVREFYRQSDFAKAGLPAPAGLVAGQRDRIRAGGRSAACTARR